MSNGRVFGCSSPQLRRTRSMNFSAMPGGPISSTDARPSGAASSPCSRRRKDSGGIWWDLVGSGGIWWDSGGIR